MGVYIHICLFLKVQCLQKFENLYQYFSLHVCLSFKRMCSVTLTYQIVVAHQISVALGTFSEINNSSPSNDHSLEKVFKSNKEIMLERFRLLLKKKRQNIWQNVINFVSKTSNKGSPQIKTSKSIKVAHQIRK